MEKAVLLLNKSPSLPRKHSGWLESGSIAVPVHHSHIYLFIMNPDQTGSVKGRYIGENIRLKQDLMFYTEKENLPGIAVFIDFRKAFDTIEWHYLEKALTHFNFGPNFLQWFKILHTDISSCILNNGHASHLHTYTP